MIFPHGQNLQTKIDENYKSMGAVFKSFKKRHYDRWNRINIQLCGIERKDAEKRVKLFEEYLNAINGLINNPKIGKPNWITPQSKFRSSALEEFVCYLLKDIDLIGNLGLKFTNKRVFTGLSISSTGDIVTMDKDVDLALVREEMISLTHRHGQMIIRVPAVAIEVKTYLDKTMWSEAQFTAQLIKRGNPSCHVYIIAETNAVSLNKLSPESPVDEIFILRKDSQEKIDIDVTYDFVCEVKSALKKIQKAVIRQSPGRLLHPKT